MVPSETPKNVHWNISLPPLTSSDQPAENAPLAVPPHLIKALKGAFQPELHADQAGDLAEYPFQPDLGAGPVVAADAGPPTR
jgi:hypothetical protein